jgi:hypothetical protein
MHRRVRARRGSFDPKADALKTAGAGAASGGMIIRETRQRKEQVTRYPAEK